MLSWATTSGWSTIAATTKYSRKHVSLDPDAKKQTFWKFSFDEMGRIDIPAIIDYISGVNKHSKMHYIGHSQGGTLPLVLGALRPEYKDKFISFQALAPGAFFIYRDPLFSIAATLAILVEVGLIVKLFRNSPE